MPDDDFVKWVKPFLASAYDLSSKSEEWINHLLRVYKSHISYGKEIGDVTSLFFQDGFEITGECKEFMETEESVPNTIKVFTDELKSIDEWNTENIALAIENTKEKASVKGKLLYMPIRIKISGQMHGPELPDEVYLMGKEEVIKYLES